GIGLGYPLAEILGEKYGPGGILQWRGIRGGAREAVYREGSRFKLAAQMVATLEPSSYPPGPKRDVNYSIEIDVSDTRSGPRVIAEAFKARHPTQNYRYDLFNS